MKLNFNEQNFIYTELANWAKIVEDRLAKEMLRLGAVYTTDLIRSLSYQVYQASGKHNGRYALSFLQYGRMVDMGAGRGRKIESAAGNRELLTKTREAKKWYSKTAYGSLNMLIKRLAENYQEGVIYTVKHELKTE